MDGHKVPREAFVLHWTHTYFGVFGSGANISVKQAGVDDYSRCLSIILNVPIFLKEKAKIDLLTIRGVFGHWTPSPLPSQAILPCCYRFTVLIHILHTLWRAGLVYDGPMGLTAVPSKISSSLEGQVFFSSINFNAMTLPLSLISQLIFLLPEPSFDYLVISDPAYLEMVSDSVLNF